LAVKVAALAGLNVMLTEQLAFAANGAVQVLSEKTRSVGSSDGNGSKGERLIARVDDGKTCVALLPRLWR